MTNLTVDPQTDPLVSSETVTVNETSHNLSKSILIEILIFILLTATAYGAYWYTKNYLVVPSPQPTVSTAPAETSQPKNSFSNLTNEATPATTDETANWKTLKTALDLELKYPNTWYIEESGSSQFPSLRIQNYPIQKTGSGAYTKGQFYFVVQRLPVGDKGISSIEQLTSRLPKVGDSIVYIGSPEKLAIYQQDTTKVGQHPALHRIYGPSGIPSVQEEIYYVLSSNDNVIQIEPKMDIQSEKGTFDQILSTFRFD